VDSLRGNFGVQEGPGPSKKMVCAAINPAVSSDAPEWDMRLFPDGVRVSKAGQVHEYAGCQAVRQSDKRLASPVHILAVGHGLSKKQGKPTWYAVVQASKPQSQTPSLLRLPLASLVGKGTLVDSRTGASLLALTKTSPFPALENVTPVPAAVPVEEEPRDAAGEGGGPLLSIPPLPAKADLRRSKLGQQREKKLPGQPQMPSGAAEPADWLLSDVTGLPTGPAGAAGTGAGGAGGAGAATGASPGENSDAAFLAAEVARLRLLLAQRQQSQPPGGSRQASQPPQQQQLQPDAAEGVDAAPLRTTGAENQSEPHQKRGREQAELCDDDPTPRKKQRRHARFVLVSSLL